METRAGAAVGGRRSTKRGSGTSAMWGGERRQCVRFFYCFVFSKITNKRICICLIQMQGREEEVNEDWHRRSEERGCQRGRGGRGGPWRVSFSRFRFSIKRY